MTLENLVNTVADHKARLTDLGNIVAGNIYNFGAQNPGEVTPEKKEELGNNLVKALVQYSSKNGLPLDGLTPEFTNVILGSIFGISTNTIKDVIPDSMDTATISRAIEQLIRIMDGTLKNIAQANTTPLDTKGANDYITAYNKANDTKVKPNVPDGDLNYLTDRAIEIGLNKYARNVTPNN